LILIYPSEYYEDSRKEVKLLSEIGLTFHGTTWSYVELRGATWSYMELKGPGHHNLKWSGDIPKWLIIRNVFAGGGGGEAVAS
jgi:hypothetical protein